MKSNRRRKVAFLATGNIHKFQEARQLLTQFKIATAMLNIKAVEIQDDDLKEIASTSAKDAAKKSGLPILVEDAGLFINALNGFPGPYSSYVYRTISTRGILKLMEKTKKRDAYFSSIIAYCNPEEKTAPRCFEGKVDGKITHEERGNQGFGFDPIFEPSGGKDATFAEMSTEEKNRHSHRAKALLKFAKWFTSGT